jgi:hypothetical protein
MNSSLTVLDLKGAADALTSWLIERCGEEPHFLESLIRDGFPGVEMMTEADVVRWLDLARVADTAWYNEFTKQGLVR